jgi:hypothetical protein
VPRMRSVRNVRAFVLLAALGCGAGSAGISKVRPLAQPAASESVVATAPEPVAEQAKVSAPIRTPVDSPRFLVHTEEGAVVERRAAATPVKTLVPHADAVLYDPALELVWYIADNQLLVLDLRARDTPPALIVRDMKDMDRLTVMRGKHTVADRDGCEGPYAVLEWTENPKVKLMLADSDERVKIDGRAWLKAQLTRTARSVPTASAFGEQQVSLPASILSCEDEETCATSVAFGDRGWQLVMVVDRSGGDCWERACLLRDPKTDKYAMPVGSQWGPAVGTTPGPCGPYRFDRSGTAYLVQRWVCAGDAACQDLDGQALGWLEPGDVVGQ